jgi:hypothetical protein
MLSEPEDPPLTEWKGIPVMPGAIAGRESDDSYEFSIEATPQEVQDFYERELSQQGYSLWAVGENDATGEPAMLMLSKGTDMLTISIIVEAEYLLVMMIQI